MAEPLKWNARSNFTPKGSDVLSCPQTRNTSWINEPGSAESRRPRACSANFCSWDHQLFQVQWAWEDQREVCLREGALGGCAVLLPLWGSKCRFKNLLNRSKVEVSLDWSTHFSISPYKPSAQVFNLLNHNPFLNNQHQRAINMLSKGNIYMHDSLF